MLVACAVALLAFAVGRRTLARQARPEAIYLLKHDQAACNDECWVREGMREADLNEGSSYRWMRCNLDSSFDKT